jgi:hypothetical protein
MTKTEKADELIALFIPIADGEGDREWFETGNYYEEKIARTNATHAAIFACDLLIKHLPSSVNYNDSHKEYWEDVKKELEGRLT